MAFSCLFIVDLVGLLIVIIIVIIVIGDWALSNAWLCTAFDETLKTNNVRNIVENGDLHIAQAAHTVDRKPHRGPLGEREREQIRQKNAIKWNIVTILFQNVRRKNQMKI